MFYTHSIIIPLRYIFRLQQVQYVPSLPCMYLYYVRRCLYNFLVLITGKKKTFPVRLWHTKCVNFFFFFFSKNQKRVKKKKLLTLTGHFLLFYCYFIGVTGKKNNLINLIEKKKKKKWHWCDIKKKVKDKTLSCIKKIKAFFLQIFWAHVIFF